MAGVTVVGLFGSKGGADNAYHRLQTEGIAASDMVEQVLSETSPPPATMEPEFQALSVDPFFWFMGDLTHDYAGYIRNGETVILVKAPTRRDATTIATILQLFDPLRVDFREERAAP